MRFEIPWFFPDFLIFFKFPDFSMQGICFHNFPCIPCFPESVATLNEHTETRHATCTLIFGSVRKRQHYIEYVLTSRRFHPQSRECNTTVSDEHVLPVIALIVNTVAAFWGMHVSPAKHSSAWLPRKCDYRTDAQTDTWTDGQTLDKVIPMCRYALQVTHKLCQYTDGRRNCPPQMWQ